jgi:hypothetical protein
VGMRKNVVRDSGVSRLQHQEPTSDEVGMRKT